jgi:hypothetical protein
MYSTQSDRLCLPVPESTQPTPIPLSHRIAHIGTHKAASVPGDGAELVDHRFETLRERCAPGRLRAGRLSITTMSPGRSLDEDLSHVGIKRRSVHRTLEHHGRLHSGGSQPPHHAADRTACRPQSNAGAMLMDYGPGSLEAPSAAPKVSPHPRCAKRRVVRERSRSSMATAAPELGDHGVLDRRHARSGTTRRQRGAVLRLGNPWTAQSYFARQNLAQP